MFLAIFLILVILFVIYILLIPIVLYVNTGKDQYYIQLRSLAKVSIEKHEKELLRINLKIAFFHFYFYPLRKMRLSKKKKIAKATNRVKDKRGIGFNKILPMLKSFKVKSFLMDIDTGDCISNAKLYPLIGFLNYYSLGRFNINFEGRNRMAFLLENRPIHIIRSFITFKI